jgi:excinuclease ABC subunit A
MDKPDVDYIEGLSPAISIEQKTTHRNPRSTVGTVTEIYDYLRLLFARIGTPHCPKCGKPIQSQTPQRSSIGARLAGRHEACSFSRRSSAAQGHVPKGVRGHQAPGVRARARGRRIPHVDDDIELERYVKHDIDVVVDRIVVKDGMCNAR